MNEAGRAGEVSLVRNVPACRNWRRKWRKPLRLPAPEPPNDEVRYIPLTKGKFAIVDASDYERLSRYKWCASSTGAQTYAYRHYQGRTISMHRFLMNPPKGMVVDHIDGNGLNNRRSNLRVCTCQQNAYNRRPKGKSSRYKGVWWDKHNKQWIVVVRRGDLHIHLGRFDDEAEAARAYDRKAFELFGEYAYLNFPAEIEGARPRSC
jgi:HNH endonuclease